MSNIILGYNNLKKIIDGKNDILHNNIEVTFFKFVYYRYNYFTKEYIKTNISNKSFGDNINHLINNTSDYVGKIYLHLLLPEVKLEKPNTYLDSIEYKNLLEKQANYNTFFSIYNSYIKDINIIIKFLKDINNTYNYNYINNFEYDYDTIINNNNTYYDTNYINSTYLSLTSYIINSYSELDKLNRFIITSEYNSINIIGGPENNNGIYNILKIINDDKSPFNNNDDIKIIINNLIIKILHNIKFLYKKIYKEYKENNEKIKYFKYYKFSWINNIGYYIFNNIKLKFDNENIYILYNDWLAIWNELNNNKININKYNNLIGNISELTTFDSKPKPEAILIINLPFFFNMKSNIYLPLLLLNNNIYLEFNLENLENCIHIDNTWKKENLHTDLSNLLKIKNININIEHIMINFNEKKNIIKENNYKNIITITEKKNILEPIQNFISEPYIITKKFIIDNPINQIYIIIQSNNISNKYNLKYNYKGFKKLNTNILNTTNKINIEEYCDILLNLELFVNNQLININDVNYLKYVNTYKNNNSNMDGLITYNFCLFPFNNQPSGHINTNINSIYFKFTFNPIFINYLKKLDTKNNVSINSSGILLNYIEEKININIYFNIYKLLTIKNGKYKVI